MVVFGAGDHGRLLGAPSPDPRARASCISATAAWIKLPGPRRRPRRRARHLAEGFDRLDQADIAVFPRGADRCLLDGQGALACRAAAPWVTFHHRHRDAAQRGARGRRVEGVYLYDIDDLKGVVQKSLAKREDDIARAAVIVAAESADCWGRLTSPPPPSAAASNT